MSDPQNNSQNSPQSDAASTLQSRTNRQPHGGRSRRSPDRLALFSWALYDWANSAFSTISITLVAVYIADVLFPEKKYGTVSGVIYPLTIGLATFLAAICAPVLGAMADAQATKHRWLSITALAGAGSGIMMGLVPVEYPWVATGMFCLTVLFFELSYGIYNAFLPELADEKGINRVSAWGFALGYIGGALALLLALVCLAKSDAPAEEQFAGLRRGIMIMGGWWGLFSLPAVLFLRDRVTPKDRSLTTHAAIGYAITEVKTTLKHIKNYRVLAIFLIGFLFYNDCVQTVISQAPIFAKKDLGFEASQLVYLVLLIQFIALPGSLLMGWLSDRWGQRPVLFLCLATWGLILLSAWFVREQIHFWVLGGFVALVMGGIQSVSRAIMGYMTPAEKSAQFFGFFNLTSKATSFLGPLIFAFVFWLTKSYRIAIISLIGQLVIGFWLVGRVDIEKGREQALENAS
jgi:UMF1 family MFS transporter